jgi:hypothetical protein
MRTGFQMKNHKPCHADSPKLPSTFVRGLGDDIGRHPTTDDLVWYFRGGKLGAWGTGAEVPAPHVED